MAEPESLRGYAGRWVARIRGQVVAQGGTPEQARQAAQAARPKEKAEITFVPNPNELKFSPLLKKWPKPLSSAGALD